jgi:hypothetical protein
MVCKYTGVVLSKKIPDVFLPAEIPDVFLPAEEYLVMFLTLESDSSGDLSLDDSDAELVEVS